MVVDVDIRKEILETGGRGAHNNTETNVKISINKICGGLFEVVGGYSCGDAYGASQDGAIYKYIIGKIGVGLLFYSLDYRGGGYQHNGLWLPSWYLYQGWQGWVRQWAWHPLPGGYSIP